jgi:hypothetical protein
MENDNYRWGVRSEPIEDQKFKLLPNESPQILMDIVDQCPGSQTRIPIHPAALRNLQCQKNVSCTPLEKMDHPDLFTGRLQNLLDSSEV